jgi:Domain of unknown function (DUF4177)
MRWEYLVHSASAEELLSTGQIRPRDMEEMLNQYGRQGWELVSAVESLGGPDGSRLVVFTFKRPLGEVSMPAVSRR